MDSPDEGGNQRSSEVIRGHQPLLIEAHCANGLTCNGLLLLDLASELLGLILGGTAHLMRQ